jgi:hypothetical protein
MRKVHCFLALAVNTRTGQNPVCPPLSHSTLGRGSRREEGNVLALVLGAIVILSIVGSALFEISNAARRRALESQYRDRVVGGVEFDLQGIRQAVALQLAQQAQLNVATLDINQSQQQGSRETGYYNLNLQSQAAAPLIFATQTHDGIQSLSAPDDPFRGLLALVDTFTVTANAQSTFASDVDSRFSLPGFALTPEMSVRQIPVSEFTLYSSAQTLQVVAPAMPVVGRIHSEGDLVILGGQLASIYPVTAGGNISVGTNGSLFAQSGPGAPASTLPVQSTSDNRWLGLARSVEHSTILSGRDLPMNMVEATDVGQMTSPALNTSGGTPISQQELWRQCTRLVSLKNGKISVRTAAGGAVSPLEASAFHLYHSPNFPGGSVIVFNLLKAPPGIGGNSFYITSTDANAVVLLINASTLPGDLAIVSPLALAIEGGFNIRGGRKAASITAREVSSVPIGW